MEVIKRIIRVFRMFDKDEWTIWFIVNLQEWLIAIWITGVVFGFLSYFLNFTFKGPSGPKRLNPW